MVPVCPTPILRPSGPFRTSGRPWRYPVTVLAQVRSDLATALKAGERERVGALRLLLSELQGAVKEQGPDADETGVLRRERKRRQDSARTYRDAHRDELAAHEEFEAGLIDTYLPAELSDAEVAELAARAVADTGASGPRAMGQAMGAAMALVAGRADGRRVSAAVREVLDR